jgi:anti-sigma factor RsiW
VIRRLLARRRFMRGHRWTGEHASAYLGGELSIRDHARVEAHAGLCPECRRALIELRRMLEGLMGLRPAPSEGVTERIIDRLRSEP